MKNTILSICLLFVTTFINAQLIKFGIKGGSTISKINGNSFVNKFEYGYHLGVFSQVKLTKKLTLQPEIFLSQINTTVDSNFNSIYSSIYNSTYRKNIDLKYITIPLVVNFNINKILALQGGAQYGILMDNNKNLLQNGQQAFKAGDLSAVGGVQLNIWKLLISGRYLIGLNNINDIDNRDKWKSQSAQLAIGFRF
jgi:hypothetical protein